MHTFRQTLTTTQKHFFYQLALLVFALGFCTETTAQIIPHPLKVEVRSGKITLDQKFKIVAKENLHSEASYLADLLAKGFSKKPEIVRKGKGIVLELDSQLYDSLGIEGYQMRILEEGVFITAADPAGIFYGIQSFRQLLPMDFEHMSKRKDINLPMLDITDRPRFPWRALMLDESRHFMGKGHVKSLLDQMAMLKMNTFHWHLTDDQGWRIEIKKYPKLTEVGSKRADTQLKRGSDLRAGKPHEGYYSQEEIKEIIAYAKGRHITIVPEIEMPGHAMAAIAAYPWLGAMGETYEVPEVFGKMPDSFNVGDPKVTTFLKDVLDEVIALFPGKAIHIGGDEVNYEPWEKSAIIQDYMQKKDINSPVDMQIYFTNQISNYLQSAGKRMVGWNEILGDDIHGDRKEQTMEIAQKLAPSSIVQFWKGDLSLIQKAAEQGYQIINSNHWDTYLDYTYERLPLSKSYAFNPIPEDLEEKYHAQILGTGTQMWTEWTPNIQTVNNQIFPRLIAYAEVGWTTLENKNYDSFLKALEIYKKRYSQEGFYIY